MKYLLIGFTIMSFSMNAWSQSKPVKVVFDVTSKDTLIHQATMRHVNLMSAAYPDSEFEVVVYGQAIEMMMNDKSTVANQISKFSNNDKVSFKVCSMTMKKHGVEGSSLIPGVDVVADGILEIVTKQGEGWGYIKESN